MWEICVNIAIEAATLTSTQTYLPNVILVFDNIHTTYTVHPHMIKMNSKCQVGTLSNTFVCNFGSLSIWLFGPC